VKEGKIFGCAVLLWFCSGDGVVDQPVNVCMPDRMLGCAFPFSNHFITIPSSEALTGASSSTSPLTVSAIRLSL
jgi:hypothetical protein